MVVFQFLLAILKLLLTILLSIYYYCPHMYGELWFCAKHGDHRSSPRASRLCLGKASPAWAHATSYGIGSSMQSFIPALIQLVGNPVSQTSWDIKVFFQSLDILQPAHFLHYGAIHIHFLFLHLSWGVQCSIGCSVPRETWLIQHGLPFLKP